MRIALLSTYEMGRQPFGLASPTAWLRAAGHEVVALDLSRDALPLGTIRDAHLVALYLPMHTATRLALKILPRLRETNPTARLCCYGLYAAMNEHLLRGSGAEVVFGGEFEQALVDWASETNPASGVSLERLRFLPPERDSLPPLDRYAKLVGLGAPRVTGYTEASRGCKHLCRHCPVVPVYRGAFRVVQRDVVLSDIRAQVAAGAQHITFGDPDFFNGPGHALPLVEMLHAEFPEITYDVTIKVEHLLKQRKALPVLKRTGCLFVTSAVESLDDAVLERFEKGHTRADFFEAVQEMRENELPLSPTFVPFTPWTTLAGFRELLQTIEKLGLVENVAPIQFAIRLLIPAGSLLLHLPEMTGIAGPFDPAALSHRWQHRDPDLDRLCQRLQELIERAEKRSQSRPEIFRQICDMAGLGPVSLPPPLNRAAVPYLNEPWYC